MQRLLLYIMTLLLLFPVSAMGEDDLDVTMRMVTDEESATDSVVREIRLPDSAADRARDAAAPGLERANEASGKGRAAADAARERARRGLERRNQRRESRGRDNVGPPDNAGPPGNEGGGPPDTGGGGPERGQSNRPDR